MKGRWRLGLPRWFVRLRGRGQPRPRRIAALRRMLHASPALLAAPAWRRWFVQSLVKVDGVPVELDLVYVLPGDVQLVVATQRAVDVGSFRPDLSRLIWNKATECAGIGMSLARQSLVTSPAEFQQLRQQEHDAHVAWLSGEGRELAVLRVDGQEVPAVQLDAAMSRHLVRTSDQSTLPWQARPACSPAAR